MSEYPKITLEAARVNAGLTQDEAANLIGINRTTLYRYESGESVPNWDTVNRISDVYQFPAQYIFFGKKAT